MEGREEDFLFNFTCLDSFRWGLEIRVKEVVSEKVNFEEGFEVRERQQ